MYHNGCLGSGDTNAANKTKSFEAMLKVYFLSTFTGVVLSKIFGGQTKILGGAKGGKK